MTAQEIKSTLAEGTFKFKYTKADGTEREATGTLNTGLIDEYGATPTGRGKVLDNTVAYYDIDKKAWRSFLPEKFVCFL